MQHHNPIHEWLIRFAMSVLSMVALLAFAQSPFQHNGVYAGQLMEITKSRQPPCSPTQSAQVVVENGVVIMPSLLLGTGQSSVISARIENNGSFTGKRGGGRNARKDRRISVECQDDCSATVRL